MMAIFSVVWLILSNGLRKEELKKEGELEEDEGGQGLEERGRNWREDGCLGKCGVAGGKAPA